MNAVSVAELVRERHIVPTAHLRQEISSGATGGGSDLSSSELDAMIADCVARNL